LRQDDDHHTTVLKRGSQIGIAASRSKREVSAMQPANLLAPQSAAMPSPGDLVTEREAAAILAASVQTLRNWRWAGKGPRVRKIGQRLVRYHRADLAAFIAGDAP
jgi:predicted DNA-binding transcriptional regulator AlpA